MQYDLKIEDVSTIRRRLSFTLPVDVVSSELDRAVREWGKKVRLPGFRPGNVPPKVIEQRFGKQVKGEVTERLMNRSWSEMLQKGETKFELVGQPAVEDAGDLRRDAPFIFSLTVEIRPELTVGDYTGVTVDFPVHVVTDEDVDRNVQSRLRSQARIEEVTDDRGVEESDLVLAELKLVDDEGTEVVNEPGTMVNMAAERYYPGVQEVLLGVKKDKTKKKKVTIGDTSVLEHLRGRELTAHVKVLGIQANRVPALSDEIAKDLGYEGGAEGMKAAIRAKLEENAQEAGRNQARANILQALVEANAFDVPSAMVQEQLNALVEEVRVRRAYEGQDPRSIQFSDAEVQDLRSRARFAAKAACILAAIARQEKLEVSEAELDRRVEEIGAMRGQTAAAIKGYLEKEGAMGTLRTRILEEQTIEWLLERAKLDEVSPEEAQKRAQKRAEAQKKAADKAAEKAAADAGEKPAKQKKEAAAAEAAAEEAPAPKKASKKKATADEEPAAEAAPAAPKKKATKKEATAPSAEDLDAMKVSDLKALAESKGIEVPAKAKKADIIELITKA